MRVEEFIAKGEITGRGPCPSLALGAGDLEGVPGRGANHKRPVRRRRLLDGPALRLWISLVQEVRAD